MRTVFWGNGAKDEIICPEALMHFSFSLGLIEATASDDEVAEQKATRSKKAKGKPKAKAAERPADKVLTCRCSTIPSPSHLYNIPRPIPKLFPNFFLNGVFAPV